MPGCLHALETRFSHFSGMYVSRGIETISHNHFKKCSYDSMHPVPGLPVLLQSQNALTHMTVHINAMKVVKECNVATTLQLGVIRTHG